MANLRSFGTALLGIAFVVGMGLLGLTIFFGVAWLSVVAFRIVIWIAQIALLLSIFVFLPFASFRKTRVVSAYGLLFSSYAFGVCLWIFGLILTWSYWGGLVVFLGLIIAGVGVVPLGILASLFHGDWGNVAALFIGVVLTFGARGLALWLGEKADRDEFERRMKIVDA